jgi:8-oxo-dGTP pyrophosphatase MutT (NUDIX family)
MSEHLRWKTLSSEYISHETWFTVRKDTCEKADGSIVPNYYVFEFPEWVTVFALTEDGKVIMEKQYRHAANEICIELPGGCVDATDANYEDAVRRELLEETGYTFETVHSLGRISANPSTNANFMHMFVATGGKKVQDQHLDDNEEIEVMLLSIDEVIQLMEEKRILQSMHMSTLFYALRYLNKLNYTL